MSRYIFTIKETYERTVCIHADSAKAAYEALSNELERKPLSDLNVVTPEIKIAEPRNLRSRSIIDCTCTATKDSGEAIPAPRYEYIAENERLQPAIFKYGMRLRGCSPGCQPTWGFKGRVDDLTGKYYDIIRYDRALTEQERKQYELDYLGVESINSFCDFFLKRR